MPNAECRGPSRAEPSRAALGSHVTSGSAWAASVTRGFHHAGPGRDEARHEPAGSGPCLLGDDGPRPPFGVFARRFVLCQHDASTTPARRMRTSAARPDARVDRGRVIRAQRARGGAPAARKASLSAAAASTLARRLFNCAVHNSISSQPHGRSTRWPASPAGHQPEPACRERKVLIDKV